MVRAVFEYIDAPVYNNTLQADLGHKADGGKLLAALDFLAQWEGLADADHGLGEG